ncbi:MAG: CopD family protein [Bacteroidota bacterium]
MTAILILKSIHVIGFVAWFAGLFYLVRMFVYHVEAMDKPEPEKSILIKQHNMMEWRVYKIIANPAMMITWTAGIGMLVLGIIGYDGAYNYLDTSVGTPGWMHAKLTLLVLLLVYHIWCKRVIKKLERGDKSFTSWQFRLLNELPTIFLVLIAFIATLGKAGQLNWMYLGIGIVAFIGLIFLGARAYKKRRETT